MKDRIQQIMIHEGMNQQEFSKVSGISPASLSSIFTGRTSPTLKHAEALHEHFPLLNMSWLLFGDGEMMLDSADHSESGVTYPSFDFDQTPSSTAPVSARDGVNGAVSSLPGDMQPSFSARPVSPSNPADSALSSPQVVNDVLLSNMKIIDNRPRRVAEIRIFYDDGTFEVFKGNI